MHILCGNRHVHGGKRDSTGAGWIMCIEVSAYGNELLVQSVVICSCFLAQLDLKSCFLSKFVSSYAFVIAIKVS